MVPIPVSTDGEQGLLSMVRLDTNRFYAAYTDSKGALQVSCFQGRRGAQDHQDQTPRLHQSQRRAVGSAQGLLYLDR